MDADMADKVGLYDGAAPNGGGWGAGCPLALFGATCRFAVVVVTRADCSGMRRLGPNTSLAGESGLMFGKCRRGLGVGAVFVERPRVTCAYKSHAC